MLKKSEVTLLLVVIFLLIPMMLGTISSVYAKSHEPTCPEGQEECLVGPPVVGTITLDMQSVECYDPTDSGGCRLGTIYYTAEFSGCCANCSGKCDSSCKRVKSDLPNLYVDVADTNGDVAINLLDLTKADFMDFELFGAGPRHCLSKNGGENIIIKQVLGLTPRNADRDADKELDAKVVFFYLVCQPSCE